MYLIILAALFLPIAICKPTLSASYSLTIAPGASFVQSVMFTEKEVATSCNMFYTNADMENITVPLDLYNEVLVNDEQYAGRITTVGHGICGIKGKNFTEDDPKSITFIFDYKTANGEEQSFSMFFYVGIYVINYNEDSIEMVNLGYPKTITCGLINTVENCKIYNPEGLLVFQGVKCKYEIAILTMEHIGTWKCVSSTLKNMEEYIEQIEYKLNENSVETWYMEEDGYAKIGCKYNFIPTEAIRPNFCQLVRPDHLTFTINPFNGGIIERYTYLGTNLQNYQCQLEFKLPRMSSEEGRWKCLIDETGGFINVGQNIFSTEPKFERHFLLKAELRKSIDLYCSVPYAAENCYFIAPDGEMHYGINSVQFWKGECGFSITVDKHHLGQWLCHFSNPNDSLDDIIIIDVQEYKKIRAEPSRILVDVGTTVDLMCRADAPIFSCLYHSPNGKIYHMTEDKVGDNIIYFGKGLGYGECGITIQNIAHDQIGRWNCSIRTWIKNENEEADEEDTAIIMMYIPYEGVGTAAVTIGIPIGIAVIAIIILSVAFYRSYKKRYTQPNSRRASVVSSSSNIAFNIPMENIRNYSIDQTTSSAADI